MEPGFGDTPLAAHRVALRVAVAVLVTSAVGGIASTVPFLLERRELHFGVRYLWVYNALWIGVRIGALTLAEEIGRAHGPIMRATGATALLFFVAPYVENWAMHFSGTVMEQGLLAVEPFEGLAYALDRYPMPSASTKVGWSQALMIAPFIALAWARTRLHVAGGTIVALVVSALSFVSITRSGCAPGVGATLFLLPAPAASVALGLSMALERQLLMRWAKESESR